MEIVLLGDLPNELGGSYYLQTKHGLKEGVVPQVDFEAESRLQEFVLNGIEKRNILSAHDLAEGGLLVALAEMLFTDQKIGAELNFLNVGSSGRLDAMLFGESQGRVLVAVEHSEMKAMTTLAHVMGIPIQKIGRSTENDDFVLTIDNELILHAKVSSLQKIWEDAIPSRMQLC